MATFYIDPTEPVSGVGTEIDPFNTWADVSWVAGNSYLQKAGTTWVGRLSVAGSGTLGNEIYLGTYGGSARAIIDATGENRAVLLFNRSFVIVENLHGKNSTDSTFQAANGANNVFRNCVATNFAAVGFFINNCTDILIDLCEAHSALDTFSAGVQLVGGTSATTVKRVTVYGISGDGIIIIGSDSNQIIECRVGPVVKDAISLEDADSNLVRDNVVVQDNFWGESYPSMKLGDNFGAGSPAALNVIMHNCFSHASTTGGALAGSNCAASNTIENNNYSTPNNPGVVAWNTTLDATVPQGNYSFSQWVAFGKYDQESFNINPDFDSDYQLSRCFPLRVQGGGITPRIVRHMRSDRWSGFVDAQNKIPQAKAPRRSAKDRIAELVAAELSMPKPPKKR